MLGEDGADRIDPCPTGADRSVPDGVPEASRVRRSDVEDFDPIPIMENTDVFGTHST